MVRGSVRRVAPVLVTLLVVALTGCGGAQPASTGPTRIPGSPTPVPEPYAATSAGYGWFIDRFEGALRQEGTGYVPGYLSELMRFQERELTVILLSNTESLDDPFLATEPIARWALAD